MFTHSGNRSRTAIGIIHRSAEWNLGRCRPKFHKSANVLAALPKSAHPGGHQGDAGNLQRGGHRPRQGRGEGVQERLRHQVPQGRGEDHQRGRRAAGVLQQPAEHWIHLRTTNPIESTFSTVRLRTKVTKGPGSRAAGLAMAFKLIEAAQGRWRAVNAPHLVPLVRAGARFCKGKLVSCAGDSF